MIMLTLDQFKATLGSLASKLTDTEVERLRDVEYQIADAIIEQWVRERAFCPPKGTVAHESEIKHNNDVHNIASGAFLLPESSGTESG